METVPTKHGSRISAPRGLVTPSLLSVSVTLLHIFTWVESYNICLYFFVTGLFCLTVLKVLRPFCSYFHFAWWMEASNMATWAAFSCCCLCDMWSAVRGTAQGQRSERVAVGWDGQGAVLFTLGQYLWIAGLERTKQE